MAKDFVRDRLTSPATADFPWLDGQVTMLGCGRYRVASYVDSQNGFGATLRTRFDATVRHAGGGRWVLEGMAIR